LTNNQQAFLELVRVGLWEKKSWLSSLEGADWEDVYQLASEQSVPSNKSEKMSITTEILRRIL
jgi:hypothetical protein